MKRFYILLTALGLLLFGQVLTVIAEPPPMDSFTARYEVSLAGLTIGESELTLTISSDGRYRMSFNTKPSGIAALLVSDQLTEQVEGTLRQGQPQPVHYRQQRGDKNNEKAVEVDFQWPQGRLLAREGNEQQTLAVQPGTVDPLSLYLQVMTDLQRGRRPAQYTLIDGTDLKTYQISWESEQTLDTPLGSLQSVPASRSKPGSDRVTRLWFAPDLNYLPIRVIQTKGDKEKLKLILQSVEGIERD